MFSTTLTAEVLGVPTKTVDNLIVQAGRGSVPLGQRGSSRTISLEIIERFALALLLRRDLDVPSVRAMQLAEQLQRDDGRAALGVIGSLHFDVTRLRSVLQQSLAAAIEGHSPRTRGRPRGQRK